MKRIDPDGNEKRRAEDGEPPCERCPDYMTDDLGGFCASLARACGRVKAACRVCTNKTCACEADDFAGGCEHFGEVPR